MICGQVQNSKDKELLRIENLKAYYSTLYGTVKAVDGIDLTVNKGEAVGLLGESGCGKSTLAFSVLGLSSAHILGGSIFFRSEDLLKKSEADLRLIRGGQISMVFQDPMTYLNPIEKAGDQIAEAISIHKKSKKEDVKKEVIEILKRVAIPSPERLANYYPHQLSGGMRQRFLIGMAISCKPSLMILDEPTTALDVTVQAQILDLIKDLRKEGISILLITHNIGNIAEICDRVYTMYAGKIVEFGDVIELFQNTMHPYTKGLLDSARSISQFSEEIRAIPGNPPLLIDPPLGCRFYARCSQAMEICTKKDPQLLEVRSGHRASCWLYK